MVSSLPGPLIIKLSDYVEHPHRIEVYDWQSKSARQAGQQDIPWYAAFVLSQHPKHISIDDEIPEHANIGRLSEELGKTNAFGLTSEVRQEILMIHMEILVHHRRLQNGGSCAHNPRHIVRKTPCWQVCLRNSVIILTALRITFMRAVQRRGRKQFNMETILATFMS